MLYTVTTHFYFQIFAIGKREILLFACTVAIPFISQIKTLLKTIVAGAILDLQKGRNASLQHLNIEHLSNPYEDFLVTDETISHLNFSSSKSITKITPILV